MAKKTVDPVKAKQARQKKIAIGGAVVLVAMLAIQVPRTMKMLNPPAEAEASTVAETTPTATPVTPVATPATSGAPAGGSAASGAAGAGGTQSDPKPTPGVNQLISFGRFASKDPFSAQVRTERGGSTATGTSPEAGAPTATTPTLPVTPPPPPSQLPSTSTPPTAPTATQARISVNGVVEVVVAGKDFPAADPTFRLVSVKGASAKIAIAGGSFTSGTPTITLKVGKPLTLMNQADGTRYVLRLLETA